MNLTPPRPRMRQVHAMLLPLFASLAAGPVHAAGPSNVAVGGGEHERITIYADPGPFQDIQTAATSERAVDWWDSDGSDDRACTESFAAVELRQLLAAALRIPEEQIALGDSRDHDARLPASGRAVFLLGAALDMLADGPPGDAPILDRSNGEAFRAFSTRYGTNAVYAIEGSSRVGTLYGVYAFIERLGVHQDGLGDRGLVLPARPPALPTSVRITESPRFVTRGFWAWEPRGNRDFFQWMVRNRMNLWTMAEPDLPLLAKLGIRVAAGGHNIQFRFLNPFAPYPYRQASLPTHPFQDPDPHPPSAESTGDTSGDGVLSYFEAHPEWYALINGKRSPNVGEETGDNYCTSNLDATAELASNLMDSLAVGALRRADVLVFWMHDNGRWCTCGPCTSQGSPSDRLFQVLGHVLDSLRVGREAGRLNSQVRLSSLAFLETILPPTRRQPDAFDAEDFSITFFPINRCYAHALADPRCVEINQWQMVPFAAWAMDSQRTYRGALEVGEYYNVDTFKSLPLVLTNVISHDIPFYRDHGVRHFTYMHAPTASWGPSMLNHVLLARMLWDPSTAAEAYVSDVLQRYYPTTHRSMAVFYRQIESAMANLKLLKHQVRVGNQIFKMSKQLRTGGVLFPYQHMQYEAIAPPVNDAPDIAETVEAMTRARAEISRAVSSGAGTLERQRLLEDERRFAYAEAMVGFLDGLIRVVLAHRADDEDSARKAWEDLETVAEALRNMGDVSRASGSHANAESGFDATGLTDVYETYKTLYGVAPDAAGGRD